MEGSQGVPGRVQRLVGLFGINPLEPHYHMVGEHRLVEESRQFPLRIDSIVLYPHCLKGRPCSTEVERYT